MAAVLGHLGRNCMLVSWAACVDNVSVNLLLIYFGNRTVVSWVACVDTVSVTTPALLLKLYGCKLGYLCCHCQCCES